MNELLQWIGIGVLAVACAAGFGAGAVFIKKLLEWTGGILDQVKGLHKILEKHRSEIDDLKRAADHTDDLIRRKRERE